MSRGRSLRVACLQMDAGPDADKNLSRVRKLALKALKARARLIALPENFCCRGESADFDRLAKVVSPRVIQEFRGFARQNKVAVLLGSLLEKSGQSKKFYNTSILISEKGRVAARYRKIHLFDVDLKTVKVRESAHFCAGSKCVWGKVWGTRAGLSICYDLRFPELYRRLTFQGCKILFVPANFTQFTGKAHWEILLRARAIENQAFVIAPAQAGTHAVTGIKSYGHSLILDPWGGIIAEGSPGQEQIVMGDLDLDFQKQVRRRLPALARISHRLS